MALLYERDEYEGYSPRAQAQFNRMARRKMFLWRALFFVPWERRMPVVHRIMNALRWPVAVYPDQEKKLRHAPWPDDLKHLAAVSGRKEHP